MAWVSWMQPRDHRRAARTMGLLVAVALVTTVVTLPLAADGEPTPTGCCSRPRCWPSS